MNRRELITAIAEDLDMDKKSTDAFLSAFIDVITSTVSKGEPVTITGFAKFARVERKARMGRNPQTGEPIKIAASKRARITPLKAFKESVLGRSGAKKATKRR